MKRYTWILAAAALPIAACSDPPTELQLRGGVAVSFATRSTVTAPTAPAVARTPAVAALDDTTIVGSDTLIVTRAQLVLREIEIKQAETASCDTGCEEIELGPVLVDLPLDPGSAQQFEIELPAGSYARIDFEIHKVSDDDPGDQAFLIQHPEFADLSIRVEGTFNGNAFVFLSDVDVEQELTLVPPLLVDDATATNVTILVDIGTWFRSDGGTLIDPETANKGGDNESEVQGNITQSLKAFEDADRDGDDTDEA